MEKETTTEGVDNKLEELNKFLEQYKKKFHLDKIKVKEVDIETTIPMLKKMDPEDIHTAVLGWGYYSLALQTEINSVKAQLEWVNSNLTRYLGVEQTEYNGFSAKERELLVLKSDGYAIKLYELKRNMQVRINQLEFLPNKVDFLVKIGQQLADNKWRERNRIKP